MNNQDFFKLFFESGEVVNSVAHPSTKGLHHTMNYLLTKTLDYFFINPLKTSGSRAVSNVDQFRNFVFEFDFGSIYEQRKTVETLGLPYSAMVFSGNKSLHVFVCLEKEISLKQFKLLASKTKSILGSDVNCIPWALGRSPTKTQTLLEVKNRIPVRQLINWIEFNYNPKKQQSSGGYDKEAIEDYILNHNCLPNNSHNMAVVAGKYLKNKGLKKSECLMCIKDARIGTTTKSAYEAIQDAEKIVEWIYEENN